MGWIGKIIGGAVGLAIGGPLGAIAGAVFGHTFDADNETYHENDRRIPLSSGEKAQFTFFVAVFSMLAKLVQADDHISQEEIDSIKTFMARDLKLSPESSQVAVNIFQAALNSPESFRDFAVQFYDQFRYRIEMLEFMIDILFRVAVADGALSANEEHLILTASRLFQFGEERYRIIRAKYVQDVDRYYSILGARSGDSNEHIKKQYRKLVKEYHPDRIASKGLPEEFNKFAQDKFREIQEAYEQIKKTRGF